MSKPLPKSLHTVTVIANVARSHIRLGVNNARAVNIAMEILGYSPENDPYKLAPAALRVLDGAAISTAKAFDL